MNELFNFIRNSPYAVYIIVFEKAKGKNMKQIIECGNAHLAIFNESNNWIMTDDVGEAKNFAADDEKKCSIISFNPSTITLHITNMCNMNCKYCFAGAGTNNSSAMDMKIIRKISKMINELNINTICIDFHGGEPLIQKNLVMDIVHYFKENVIGKKIVYYIQTNATLIDDGIAKFFKKYNFIVGVSLDGDIKTNDSFRVMANGDGSWHKILNGIEILRRWHVPFSCLAVVTTPSSMLYDYEFFVSRGIYNIQFMPVMPQGRAMEERICTENWIDYANQEIKVFNKVLDDRNSGKPIIHSSSYTLLKKIMLNRNDNICMKRPCGAGQDILVIDEHGDIYPCDSLMGTENIFFTRLGNLKEYEHFYDIANSKEYRKYISMVQKNSLKCKDCFCKSICCGGCKSDVFNAYGRWDRETPLCEYYQYVIKQYFKVLYERRDDVINYLKGRSVLK